MARASVIEVAPTRRMFSWVMKKTAAVSASVCGFLAAEVMVISIWRIWPQGCVASAASSWVCGAVARPA